MNANLRANRGRITAALAVALAGTFCPWASAYEFTDPYGRKMNAEILSAAGDTVTIRREDNNKEYTVKSASFSKADQEYIRQWVKDNPGAITYRMRVLATPYSGSSFGAGINTATKSIFRYRITVYNQSELALPDIEVFYKVFVKRHNYRYYSTYTTKRNTFSLKSVEGSAAVKEVKKKGKVEIITRQPEFRIYREGGSRRKADELAGIRVKIFRGKKMIREDKIEARPGDLNGAAFIISKYESAPSSDVIVHEHKNVPPFRRDGDRGGGIGERPRPPRESPDTIVIE